MNVFDSARVIIYRINKKGLEVFMVNTGEESQDNWSFPHYSPADQLSADSEDRFIELDPVSQKNGELRQAYAIEGDWHEIPSIRKVIKEDVRIVKDQLKQRFPELEKGTYIAVKEAFKKVLPEEYAFLKELKDVVVDRNQAKYI